MIVKYCLYVILSITDCGRVTARLRTPKPEEQNMYGVHVHASYINYEILFLFRLELSCSSTLFIYNILP